MVLWLDPGRKRFPADAAVSPVAERRTQMATKTLSRRGLADLREKAMRKS